MLGFWVFASRSLPEHSFGEVLSLRPFSTRHDSNVRNFAFVLPSNLAFDLFELLHL